MGFSVVASIKVSAIMEIVTTNTITVARCAALVSLGTVAAHGQTEINLSGLSFSLMVAVYWSAGASAGIQA